MRVPDEYLSATGTSHRRPRAAGDGGEGPVFPGTLVVVSNRQPYRHTYASEDATTDGAGVQAIEDTATEIAVDEPTGGLTAGLDPVVKQTNGTWIAWGDGDADFDVADEDNCVSVPPDDPAYTLRRIELTEEAVDSYYRGFSNQVLWPLCHEFVELVEDRANDFEWYRTINERFAEAAIEHATADSVIWLQDYHFALAPGQIREGVPDSVTIAQFWHIPWPAAETFRYCPAGGQLLRGLLGNDLLAFHIDRYADHFLECVERYCAGATVDWQNRCVHFADTTTWVVATPLGIDAESYAEDALAADHDRSSLLDRFGIPQDAAFGLGVDRLDYTKGIPERVAGIERFFERNPDWKGAFTFLQTATPSRTEIETYERYGEFVRSEVERVNQRFGQDDWQPIVYTEEFIESDVLAALYRHADLMLISPLLDGMNLVAQEYVAANVDVDGCLLLSDRTGAHGRLGSHALTIDPTDTDQVAAQIERALLMPPHERTRRMETLRTRVFQGDIEAWMHTQFDWIRWLHEPADASTGSDTDSDSHESTPPV